LAGGVLNPVVLVVGDAVAATGFARVTTSLIERLKARYQFHQLGINYSGDPHDCDWPIYPAHIGGDPHGVKRIAELVDRIRPDIVLMINDLWIVGDYLRALAKARHRPATMAYVPIDAVPLIPEHVRSLAPLDRIVVYNRFGAEAFQAASRAIQETDLGFRLPPLDVVAHGLDTKTFHPLFPLAGNFVENRQAVRRNLLPHGEAVVDDFIVLNANRNQPRKRIDLTIEGFAIFAAGKPQSVKLYLHMGATDLGWDVVELTRRHGIFDRLMMTHDGAGPPSLSSEQLNLVYNTCDVGINTADAEAWGLPAFEHAATGAAQLVPGHSSQIEIWGGAAELLRPRMQVTIPATLSRVGLIAPDTIAGALQVLYDNPERLLERSAAAYRRATDPAMGWDRAAQQFDGLIGNVLSRRREPGADGVAGPAASKTGS
jgi:D-inositol-3-phosphate glycosyltransferase